MSQAQTLRRQEQILALLDSDGTLTVEELAGRLDVSVWTVRRDLSKLEACGGLARRHGRAEAAGATDADRVWRDDSLRLASAVNPEGKRRIGRAAAGLIPPHAHVALGAGSTALEVARALRDLHFQGEVVTNALDIALELAEAPGVRVVCTGGEVQPRYHTLAGAVTERVLKLHFFDVAVIGVSGVAAPQGFTVNSQVEAATLGLMVEHARRVIVVADRTKFGRVAFAALPVDAPGTVLVTDGAVEGEIRKMLAARNVQLVL